MTDPEVSALELIALVPARRGSKRLPGKNRMVLGDRPLLAWADAALRRSGVGAPVYLSTDDEELVPLARSLGWEVPFLRPAHLADDGASTVSVALHLLDHLRDAGRAEPEALLLLQPSSPFREPALIAEACARLAAEPDLDAVISVTEAHTPLWAWCTADGAGRLHPIAGLEQRRERAYSPSGAVYVIRTAALRAEETFMPARLAGLPHGLPGAHDIDTPEDWRLAESLLRAGLEQRETES